jgi:hypothetical protein
MQRRSVDAPITNHQSTGVNMQSAAAWAVLIGLACASPVAAQEPEAPRVFFDGAAFVGFERAGQLRSERPIVRERDASATVAGGAAAVGTFLGPRVSLRLEASFPGPVDTTYSSGSGFVFTSLGVGTSPMGSVMQLLSSRVEEERRERSASVLIGYHTARRNRVRVGFLAGVAFLWQQQRTVIEQTLPTFPFPVLPTMPGGFPVEVFPPRIDRSETSATSYRAAPAVGLDVDIAMAAHLAVVPQMRVQASGGVLSLRPGIAVRWTP